MPRGKFSVTGETTLLAKLAGDFKDCEWIYRFGANPGMPRGGVLPPNPVLAPESTLGSRPRVALSSAQAGAMYCRPGPAGCVGSARMDNKPALRRGLDPLQGSRGFYRTCRIDLSMGRKEHVMAEWEEKKTKGTRKIESLFRTEFPQTDAYRFNSASIRVRVIDDRFEGKSIAEREAMVLPLLKKLPKKTRDDVLLLLTLAPSEQRTFNSQTLMNLEFEQPLPSRL